MGETISSKKFKIKGIFFLITLLFFVIVGGIFFLNKTSAQVCLPLEGYLVWPGTWEPGRVPMASTSQYYLTASPIFVSNDNIGIGYTSPVYKLQVSGDISGTRLCIGSDCRDVWPGGAIGGSGSAGQITFWSGTSTIAGDNNLFWDNTNKRLGLGTTTPQTSLYVVGNVTANAFLGTINAANVSSGQFGANTGGGNYYFMGNVGIGTTNPGYKLDVASGGSTTARFGVTSTDVVIVGGGAGKIDVGTVDPIYTINGKRYATYLSGMTGVKEETAGIIKVDNNWQINFLNNKKVYVYKIDFKNQEEGSDLWLFSKVTNLKKNFDKLVVILTPSFETNFWYRKDSANLILEIYIDKFIPEAEISYRFTAPRFDYHQWPNYSNSNEGGFIINDD